MANHGLEMVTEAGEDHFVRLLDIGLEVSWVVHAGRDSAGTRPVGRTWGGGRGGDGSRKLRVLDSRESVVVADVTETVRAMMSDIADWNTPGWMWDTKC